MQRCVCIINQGGKPEFACAFDLRAFQEPTFVYGGERCCLVFIGDKVERVCGTSQIEQAVELDGFWIARIAFPGAVHTDGFGHSCIIVSVDENFLRNRFVDVTSDVPSAVFRIDFEGVVLAVFIDERNDLF